MHDDFLHHLRKEPPPEFAARLRTRLRRQPMSPPRPGASARVRTLFTLLLLGGTAFAITSVVMRGLPRPILVLYQQTMARISAAHDASATHRAGTEGILERLGWPRSSAGPPPGVLRRSGPTHPAALPMSAAHSQASAGGTSSAAAPAGGANLSLQRPAIRVLTSWAAYPYVAAVAQRLELMRTVHIAVSVGNSTVWRDWPHAMCSDKWDADIAYTYEPVGTVSTHPCPPLHRTNVIITIPLGYEAVVLARSPVYGALNLTRRDMFLALAKWVPDPGRPGTVHENVSTQWGQIHAGLGSQPIQLLGPPLSSDVGRSMIELLMEGGCDTYSWIAALKSTDPAKYARICRTVRTDGVYGVDANLHDSELLAEPNTLGIFGFADLTNLGANLAVSRLDGVVPTPQDIESGAYPASRGIYLYVNRWTAPRNVVLSYVQGDLSAWPRSGVVVALSEAQRQAAFAAAIY